MITHRWWTKKYTIPFECPDICTDRDFFHRRNSPDIM